VFDQAFIPLSENPLFLWLYVTVLAIAAVAAIAFWFLYRHYNKEDDEMNSLDKTSTNLPSHEQKATIV
jgi:proton-dependent oligopeptide transporter, POT family